MEGEQIEKFKSIIVDKNEIKASHLVIGIDKAPQQFLDKSVLKDQKVSYISRGIFITDKSVKLHINKDPYITLVLYPPEKKNNLTTILELGNYTGTCAEDTCKLLTLNINLDKKKKKIFILKNIYRFGSYDCKAI